jgi:hypothetical protein
MKHYTVVKATWIANYDGDSKVYFDYFNKEGDFIGNIIVGEKGQISWYIIDATYKDDIIEVVNYLMGNNDNKRLQGEYNKENDIIWYNMRLYIHLHKIYLNTRQGEEEQEKDNTR